MLFQKLLNQVWNGGFKMRTGDYVLGAIRKGERDEAIEKVFRNPIHAKIHAEFLVKEGYAVSINLLLKCGQRPVWQKNMKITSLYTPKCKHEWFLQDFELPQKDWVVAK